MLYYAEVCNELAGPSPRHCARAIQLLLKKCCIDSELLVTLCLIESAQDLNLRAPVSEANTLPLDQLESGQSF